MAYHTIPYHTLPYPLPACHLRQVVPFSPNAIGFRPIELRLAAMQVYDMFLDLFPGLFSGSKNDKYLAAVRKSVEKKLWKRLSHGLTQAVKMAHQKFESGSVSPTIRSGWTAFAKKIALFERQRKQLASGFAFSFVEVRGTCKTHLTYM